MAPLFPVLSLFPTLMRLSWSLSVSLFVPVSGEAGRTTSFLTPSGLASILPDGVLAVPSSTTLDPRIGSH